MIVGARVSKHTCLESFRKVFVDTIGFGRYGLGYSLDVEVFRRRHSTELGCVYPGHKQGNFGICRHIKPLQSHHVDH